MGERVPIVVSINYANLAQSTLSLHLAYADYPPRFQSGGEATVSGSGTYLFPPAEIMVPASYSIPSGWPEYINEWHLKAEIWKGDQLVAGRAFTLLVENPEYKPDVEIGNIEYVVPPDTIAVGEESLVKVHTVYSNLAAGTKIEGNASRPIGHHSLSFEPVPFRQRGIDLQHDRKAQKGGSVACGSCSGNGLRLNACGG